MRTRISRTNRFYALALFICGAFLYTGCGSGSIVQDKFTVPNGEWKIYQAFNSKFVVTDTINPYNFYLNVRNGGDYPYSNLYVFATMTYPNGKKMVDTVFCPLADKSGRWLGDGLGDVLDNRILYHAGKRFPMGGEYKIQLRHAMYDTLLPEILNLGISIEQAN